MSTYGIVLDGVIRRRDEGVIPAGQRLYDALCAAGRVAVFCGEDKDKADWFLKVNHMTKHAFLVAENPHAWPTDADRRKAQIRHVRADGASMDFVVEPDPHIAAELVREGIPVMVYVEPRFSHPSFRPDFKSVASPWSEMTAEIEYQEEQKAAKKWTEVD